MSDRETPEDAAETPATEEGAVSSRLAEVGNVHFEVLLKLDSMGLLHEGSLQCVVKAVCSKDPDVFLANVNMVRLSPELVESAVRALLAKNPDRVFTHTKLFADQPWAKEVLLAAIQHGGQGNKLGNWVFSHVEHFADQPWAEEVFLVAVQNDGAWGAFNSAQKLVALPFGEKILREAAPLNMWAAIHFVNGYKDAPFARDLLIDLVSNSFVSKEGKDTAPPPRRDRTIKLTTRNGTSIGLQDLQRLAELPFAQYILEAFAHANSALVKKDPYTFRRFPGARQIFEKLDLDPVACGCYA